MTDHAEHASPAPSSDRGTRRDSHGDKQVWAAVQACGDVHAALFGHGTATFADRAHNYPPDGCATCLGGPCTVPRDVQRGRVKHHAYAMYDACALVLGASTRALTTGGLQPRIEHRIALVAAAYRHHASAGGLFVEWRHTLKGSPDAFQAALRAGVRAVRATSGVAPSPAPPGETGTVSPEARAAMLERAAKLGLVKRPRKGPPP